MTDWQRIGAQISQTGTVLRFTGKNAHAIMVMLKIVTAPISIPFFRHLQTCRCCFFCSPYAVSSDMAQLTGSLSRTAGLFYHINIYRR